MKPISLFPLLAVVSLLGACAAFEGKEYSVNAYDARGRMLNKRFEIWTATKQASPSPAAFCANAIRMLPSAFTTISPDRKSGNTARIPAAVDASEPIGLKFQKVVLTGRLRTLKRAE